MNWILDFFIRKSQFPFIQNADLELRKAGLLRISLGCLIFIRFTEIAYSLNFIGSKEAIAWSIAILILIFLFTIGLFAPFVSLLLFASLRIADHKFGTDNLGTILLLNTLLVLILINHWRYYSVDSVLLQSDTALGRRLKKIYTFFGNPTKYDITKSYLLGFIVYAVISFGALLLHISDDYWREGITVKSLLTNSYLGKQYKFFRMIDSSYPVAFGTFSMLAGIFQSVFQFLMIPLLFFRIGKWFIILWGLNFILSSLFFINLSYLPHVELILWGLIFLPMKEKSKQILTGSDLNLEKDMTTNRKFLSGIFYNIHGILLLLFILFGFPFIKEKTMAAFFKGDTTIADQFKNTVDKVGLHIPGVFNRVDLSMGNNWMVLYRKNGANWEIVPITDLDGARLNYLGFDIMGFSNHNSDVLYFGTTLGYRRDILNKKRIGEYHEREDALGWRQAKMLINYDFKLNHFNQPVDYRIEIFHSNSSETMLFTSDQARHDAKLIYSKVYSFNGADLTIK